MAPQYSLTVHQCDVGSDSAGSSLELARISLSLTKTLWTHLQSFGVEKATSSFEGPLPAHYEPWDSPGLFKHSTGAQQDQRMGMGMGWELQQQQHRKSMHWQSAAAASAATAAESALQDSEPRPAGVDTNAQASSSAKLSTGSLADMKLHHSNRIQGPSV
jgi:hypothetical protein